MALLYIVTVLLLIAAASDVTPGKGFLDKSGSSLQQIESAIC